MTPSALTPAARGSTKKSRPDASSRPSSSRGSGHRSTVRRSAAPTAPRRVSGPAGGITRAVAASASGGVIAVPPPTRTRPARPARPRGTRRTAAKAPWRLRTSAYVRALPDHALLDRIIRGRVWIPLLGLLLAGIVAMQVEVLKLNAGIGRSLERSSALQGQNELLRANVSQLSDEQRVERLAAQMGMVMPAPTQLRFVRGGASSVERALGTIHPPNGASFIAALPTIGAPAAPQGTTVNTGVGVTPTTASSTASTVTGAAGSTDTGATSSTASTSGTTDTGTTTGATGAGTSTPTSTATGTPATTGSSSGSTSDTSTATPTAPTSSAGATDQSGSSSSGGATPIGG